MMSSIDWHAISGAAGTATAAGRIGRIILAGVFLALSAAVVPVATIYSFIWMAKI